MSVKDKRRPPFAWLSLEALRTIRRELPSTRQPAARNAYSALAEAASVRRDGRHEEGDTLRELAALAGVSERRLREPLQDLARLGIVRVEAPTDEIGRDLAKVYALLDSPRSDESSGQGDTSRTGAVTNRPTPRARPEGVELQEEDQDPPTPPAAGGRTIFPLKPTGYRSQGRKRKEDLEYDDDVEAFVAEHFPGAPSGLIAHHAGQVRLDGAEATVDAIRPLVDQYRPCVEAA